MLQSFGIAWQFDVDHKRQVRKVDTASGNVGRDADAGAAVPQRLQCLIAFALAMLTRQRHRIKAAIGQFGVKVTDALTRRTKQDRRFGFMQTEEVDHCVFNVWRGNGDDLIANVSMPAIFTDSRNAQCIMLVAFGERDNRFGHRG